MAVALFVVIVNDRQKAKLAKNATGQGGSTPKHLSNKTSWRMVVALLLSMAVMVGSKLLIDEFWHAHCA
jgi:hypothetical protein